MLQYWLVKRVLLLPLLWRKYPAGQTLVLWLSSSVVFAGIGAPPSSPLSKPLPSQAVEILLDQGRRASKAGHSEEATAFANQAVDLASASHDARLEVEALLFLSACRIRVFDYRGARDAAEKCREIASEQHDFDQAASASVNLASIYLGLGDYRLAEQEASRASSVFARLPNSSKERQIKAFLIYAESVAERTRRQIRSEREASDMAGEERDLKTIEAAYQRAIDVAHAARLPGLEASCLEEMAYSLILANHPERARAPLERAHQIEVSNHLKDALPNNEEHQAELELQTGNYQRALELIDRAFAAKSGSFLSTPQFNALRIRGVILEKLKRPRDALDELHKAVDVANQYRRNALPGDATRTLMVVLLQDVYHDYAQLAAELSLKTRNPALAVDGFVVMAENRASNLREESAAALSRSQVLPPHYLDLLAELQSAQAKVSLGGNRPEDKARLDQLRLQIRDLENQFGITDESSQENSENNSAQKTLNGIQGGLTPDQALLSFSLGEERSFVWTVTGDSVNVYRLASEPDLASTVHRFSADVESGRDPRASGLKLSRDLLGVLPESIWKKRDWLIAGEGALLGGLPFSALTDLSSGIDLNFLTEIHSIRLIPSELFLVHADKIRARQIFVGIGDPIYNSADPRHASSGHAASASMSLARLPASDHEISNAAHDSGMPVTRLLIGSQANIACLRQALAEDPAIIHFAVHVVPPENSGSQAAIALSLGPDNIPELLMPEEIAAFRVPGSLIILSGCSSQRGEVLPGAGLTGLSRAWLLAGASAVVVSAWPTPDDSGLFFSSFYKHLATQAGSVGQRAARALAAAQRDMQQQHNYLRSPSFWAAYSLISKE